MTGDDFLGIFSVNVVGPYQMVRAVAPHMKEQGRGAIVNISSLSGMSGSGSSIAYAASKAALNTMTLSLARALAPEIRVNAVCPGVMQTRWWQEGLGEERYAAFIQNYADSAPLKTAGTPEAVSDPVVWLLEGAEQVTGETLIVDSGSHLGGASRRLDPFPDGPLSFPEPRHCRVWLTPRRPASWNFWMPEQTRLRGLPAQGTQLPESMR